MKYFIITLGVLLITCLGMAVGYIFSKKELKGSCGGLGKIMGEDCMFCDKKEECDEDPELKGECVKLECTEDGKVELSVQQ
ncbi:(Na+)-NQR maturation NqrM [Halobacteriovorax sp. GB3]|uniref:(Na+)-NQR maturation NqrM n=1 Tax=Halobacteriovorax sp. GB3 TaxID=2719615 RepID=UPI0023627DBF|nr:(Na+)-NQR maturation NqrM [Halobacteriovorax sp. GB3]MDD0853528.1 (Na+)-NQR maturation NqrM [Halobacteriovorax sp. GB3]